MTKGLLSLGDRVQVNANYFVADLANLVGTVVDFYKDGPESALVQFKESVAGRGHDGCGRNETGESFPNSWYIPVWYLTLREKRQQPPKPKLFALYHKTTNALLMQYPKEQQLHDYLRNFKQTDHLYVVEYEQIDTYGVKVDYQITKVRKEGN